MASFEELKGDRVISVADLTDRVDELREERDASAAWANDNAEELETLEGILQDLCGYGGNHQWDGEWYPDALIARFHFVNYCRETVSDIGDMPKEIPSYIEIDWDKTADNLEADYSTVDVDGDEYLYLN